MLRGSYQIKCDMHNPRMLISIISNTLLYHTYTYRPIYTLIGIQYKTHHYSQSHYNYMNYIELPSYLLRTYLLVMMYIIISTQYVVICRGRIKQVIQVHNYILKILFICTYMFLVNSTTLPTTAHISYLPNLFKYTCPNAATRHWSLLIQGATHFFLSRCMIVDP